MNGRVNLLRAAEQQYRTPHRDPVAHSHDTELDRLTIHSRPVRTIQIGQDDLPLIFLDLCMEPADPLVVELDQVAFLTADGDRGEHVAENPAAVHSVEDL